MPRNPIVEVSLPPSYVGAKEQRPVLANQNLDTYLINLVKLAANQTEIVIDRVDVTQERTVVVFNTGAIVTFDQHSHILVMTLPASELHVPVAVIRTSDDQHEVYADGLVVKKSCKGTVLSVSCSEQAA